MFHLLFFSPGASSIGESCSFKRIDLKYVLPSPIADTEDWYDKNIKWLNEYVKKHNQSTLKKEHLKKAGAVESETGKTIGLGVRENSYYFRICSKRKSFYYELELRKNAFVHIKPYVNDGHGSNVISKLAERF